MRKDSTVSYQGARFELTLRGQLVRHACDRMLDARPPDVDPSSRCQGRPGDDFVSVFRVGPKEGCDDYELMHSLVETSQERSWETE